MRIRSFVPRAAPRRAGIDFWLLISFVITLMPLLSSGCGGSSSSKSTPTPTATATPTPGFGRSIVYSSAQARNGINLQIYTIQSDGSNVTRLTNNSSDESACGWSPDGGKILFSSNRDNKGGGTNNRDLYVMDSAGNGVARLTNDTAKNSVFGSWSPNGAKIAFSRDRQIKVMNADGSNIIALTGEDVKNALNPVWSPDGTKIAFIANAPGVTGDSDYSREIFVIQADGTGLAALTAGGEYIHQVAWSPDGQTLVFDSSMDTGGASSLRTQLYRMNVAGGSRVRLSQNAGSDVAPVWSPDGTQILFSSNRDRGGGSGGVNPYDLYVMRSDGSSVSRLTTTGSDGFVAPGGWKR